MGTDWINDTLFGIVATANMLGRLLAEWQVDGMDAGADLERHHRRRGEQC